MFNEFSVYQMMKFPQEETERNARNAWKHYTDSSDKKDLKPFLPESTTAVSLCCQCACT